MDVLVARYYLPPPPFLYLHVITIPIIVYDQI